LNTSVAAAAGELWPKECRPLQWPGAGVEGFAVFQEVVMRPKPCSLCKFSVAEVTFSENTFRCQQTNVN